MRASRLATVLVGLVLLGVLGGCTPSARDSLGTAVAADPPIPRSVLSVGGVERGYIVHAPKIAISSKRLPLLIVLHGAGSNAATMQSVTGFSRAADANDFIVAYPEGTQAGEIAGEFSWNAEGCCGAPARSQVDDVGFIDALITSLESQFTIDPARIYVTGFSNGGMLSYRLSCALAPRIAGVAVVGGAFNVTVCESPSPMSALIIHGRADATVPYSGGSTNERTAARFGQWQNASVHDAVAFWVDRNDCVEGTDAAGVSSGEPRSMDADGARTEIWSQCAAGTRLELISIDQGTHVWPKIANENVDATATILEYLGLS